MKAVRRQVWVGVVVSLCVGALRYRVTCDGGVGGCCYECSEGVCVCLLLGGCVILWAIAVHARTTSLERGLPGRVERHYISPQYGCCIPWLHVGVSERYMV